MIIGLTGPICSGKGTGALIIRDRGYKFLSFGDEVRLEAEARGIALSRERLQALGFKLTEEFGESYWAIRLLSRIETKSDYVVDGFRYPGQVEIFRANTKSNFILVGINAPFEILRERYENKRKRTEDTLPFEEAHARDWDGVEGGQKGRLCYEMANFKISNETNDTSDLEKKIHSFLREIESF